MIVGISMNLSEKHESVFWVNIIMIMEVEYLYCSFYPLDETVFHFLSKKE